MNPKQFAGKALFCAVLAFLCFSSVVESYAASIAEFTAVGRVESIYRDRITMRILEIISSDTADLGVATGSWISFDLPKTGKKSGRNNIRYGTVVEAALIGNVMTEYETSKTGDPEAAVSDDPGAQDTENASEEETSEQNVSETDENSKAVLLWTAQSVAKVKNQKKYTDDSKKKEKKEKKKKEKAPVKIWTQEETIRGAVLVKKDLVYIKEDRVGRRDKGLQVLAESWAERLKELSGQRVVIHGTSHRTSISSGTVEIENILKVYPK